MATIILAFEYKTSGLPGRYGPGDSLRLSHALRHPAFALSPTIRLLSTLPAKKLDGLFPKHEFVEIMHSGGSMEAGDVQPAHLADLLAHHIAPGEETRVLHGYIGAE